MPNLTPETFLKKLPQIVDYFFKVKNVKDISIYQSTEVWNKDKLCFLIDENKKESAVEMGKMLQYLTDELEIDMEDVHLNFSWLTKEKYQDEGITHKKSLKDIKESDLNRYKFFEIKPEVSAESSEASKTRSVQQAKRRKVEKSSSKSESSKSESSPKC